MATFSMTGDPPLLPEPAETAPRAKYTGVAACAECHKDPETGYQFSRWRMSPHAQAYATLVTPRAFDAILFDSEKKVSVVQEALCKGCGTCVAACPTSAATQMGFTDRQIYAEIAGALAQV